MKQKLRLKGKMQTFVHATLLLGLLLVVVDIWIYSIDVKAGVVLSGFVVFYLIMSLILVNFNKNILMNEMVSFATQYGQIQKKLLRDLELPSALLDETGRVVWTNRLFEETIHKPKGFNKEIRTIFPSLTKDRLPKDTSEISQISFSFEEKEFTAKMRRIPLAEMVENSDILRAGNVRECDFADSNKIAILESSIAVGNANGKGISATMGRVNVDSEEITLTILDDQVTVRVIRTDAMVNKGNSGGGLFNSKGELIGIVNAKNNDIGYAIPSNVAKYIADNIIYYCDGETKTSVKKCLLGITVQIEGLYTEYDTETGVLYKKERVAVKSINSTSVAKNILKVGDVINHITIDGVKYEVSRIFHVVDSMLNARANSNIVINVTRGGEALDLSVKVSSANIVNADS
jgi:hypothetical protein